MIAMPPASSIFINIDVPERGNPLTTTMGSPCCRRNARLRNSSMADPVASLEGHTKEIF
jgi:hypothetical protein